MVFTQREENNQEELGKLSECGLPAGSCTGVGTKGLLIVSLPWFCKTACLGGTGIASIFKISTPKLEGIKQCVSSTAHLSMA